MKSFTSLHEEEGLKKIEARAKIHYVGEAQDFLPYTQASTQQEIDSRAVTVQGRQTLDFRFSFYRERLGISLHLAVQFR